MKNKIFKTILLIIFLTSIYYIIQGYIIRGDVKNKGKISIGKYVSQDKWAKGELNYFIFYINGKKYRGNGGRAPRGFIENIGKFYQIKYSQTYKGEIEAFFSKQITDTVAILKVGFTKEDIKK